MVGWAPLFQLSRSQLGCPQWNTLCCASLLMFLSVLFIKLQWEWVPPVVPLDYLLVLLKLKPNALPEWTYWHRNQQNTEFRIGFLSLPCCAASFLFAFTSHLHLLMIQRVNLSCLCNKYSFCHVPFIMGEPESVYRDSLHLMEHDQGNKLLRSESPVYRAGGNRSSPACHTITVGCGRKDVIVVCAKQKCKEDHK